MKIVFSHDTASTRFEDCVPGSSAEPHLILDKGKTAFYHVPFPFMKSFYLSLKSFVPWKNVERPVDWARRFGRSAPLYVEIGFGNGEFLARNALETPRADFIGIELEWPSVKRGLRRIAQTGAGNVRVLQVNARLALERLIAPKTIGFAYALFPPPWPKEKHERFRLFSHDFLLLLNSRLVDGGSARIVTDDRAYADWVLGQVDGTGFDGRLKTVSPGVDTKYERKWRGEGREDFFELSLTKENHVAVPLKEDVQVNTHRIPHFDPARFRPKSQSGPVSVIFRDLVYDPQLKKGLCQVVAAEDGLVQHLFVEISWTGEDWHIKPSSACAIIPTVGIQRALDLVFEAAGE